MPMAELRDLLEGKGMQAVKTWLNSGNVALTSEVQLDASKIESWLSDRFAFRIPVILKEKAAVENLLKNNPFNSISTDKDLK